MSVDTPLFPLPVSQILTDENLARAFCADGLDLMQVQVANFAFQSANPADKKAHEIFSAVLLEHFDFDLSETMGGRRDHAAELKAGEFENSAVAAFALGCMARHGLGSDKNAEHAQEWFDKALGLGLRTALPCLVESLYGFCTLDDPEFARLCRQAVESDDPLCLLHLGRLLLFGLELEERDALSVQEGLWAMARAGSVDALRMLALLETDLARHEGETPRSFEAREKIRELAEKEHAPWANLFCYELCAHIMPSFTTCEEEVGDGFLADAVEQGNVQAVFYDVLLDDLKVDPVTGYAAVQLNASLSEEALAKLGELAQQKIPRALLLVAALLHDGGAVHGTGGMDGMDGIGGRDSLPGTGEEERGEKVFRLLEKAFARRRMFPQSTCLVAYLVQRLRNAALSGFKAGQEASGQDADKARSAFEEILRLAESGVPDAQFAAAKMYLTGAFGVDADVEKGAGYLARAVRAGHDEAIVFGVWARAVWESETLDTLDLPKHLCAGASWLKPNALATTFIAMYPPMVWLDPNSDPDTQDMKEMGLAGIAEAVHAVHSPVAQALLAMHEARVLAHDMDRLGMKDIDAASLPDDLCVDSRTARLQELLAYVNAYGAVDALFQLLVLMDALPPVCSKNELAIMGQTLCRAMRSSSIGMQIEGNSLEAARAWVLELLARFGIAKERANEAAFLFVNWPQNACGSLQAEKI